MQSWQETVHWAGATPRGGADRRRRLAGYSGGEGSDPAGRAGEGRRPLERALKSLDAKSFRRSGSHPRTSPRRRMATGSPERWRSTAHLVRRLSTSRVADEGRCAGAVSPGERHSERLRREALLIDDGHPQGGRRGHHRLRRQTREIACRRYQLTTTGSPMPTVLKYHRALSGLRLMQPWLTLAYPCEPTDHGAECTYTPPQVMHGVGHRQLGSPRGPPGNADGARVHHDGLVLLQHAELTHRSGCLGLPSTPASAAGSRRRCSP